MSGFLLGLSILLELAAALLAVRLIAVTHHKRAWTFIAGGLTLAVIRRSVLFYSVVTNSGAFPPNVLDECLTLVISLLTFAGVALIGPLFHSFQRAASTLRQAQEELEHHVAERTEELAEANRRLTAEIAEHKQAQAEIEQEQQRLRNLLDVHERERQLIAYEIHDGLVQLMTGALLNFQALGQPPSPDSPPARQTFQRATGTLAEAIAEARRLIGGLRPPALDEAGLAAAVEDLVAAAEKQRQGVSVYFRHDVQFERLAPPLETALFRIVQESLTNALRHSGSSTVQVNLTQHENRVRLEILDEGCGFDPAAVEPNRFGLQGIRQRAELFGGTLKLSTAPGQGTRVVVDLPLVAAATP